MSRGSGSSVIPGAVFLALLLIVLPVSADNVTASETTVAAPLTANVTPAAANTTPVTTIAGNGTTNATPATTVVPPQTTAAPVNTTVAVTRPPAVITTPLPTITSAQTIATGSVNVYSSPAGASILIDGIYAGTTPNTVNAVPAGNHILRLTLSGYNDYEGSIFIIPGQPAQGYGTLQPISHGVSAVPTQTVIVPVIVPVATATPAQDPGPLGNTTVITAIIGAIAVIIGSAATIFNHTRPPKKE